MCLFHTPSGMSCSGDCAVGKLSILLPTCQLESAAMPSCSCRGRMHVKQPVVSRGVTCCCCQSESQDAAILGELAAHVSALLESSPAASHRCEGRAVALWRDSCFCCEFCKLAGWWRHCGEISSSILPSSHRKHFEGSTNNQRLFSCDRNRKRLPVAALERPRRR